MSDPRHEALTQLLAAAARGERHAARDLLPLVYQELRGLAQARMRQLRPGQTLEPTALVHEAYLRLMGKAECGWDHRGHFFAAAAGAMRDILVDAARRRASLKRGGDRQRVNLEEVEPAIRAPSDDVVAVHEALRALEQADPRKRELINLRYFAGFSNEETAAALGVSVGTVEREWRYVRAWLKRELGVRGSAED
jgi:RNA polymerase sigma factor (TIGR02999 family)